MAQILHVEHKCRWAFSWIIVTPNCCLKHVTSVLCQILKELVDHCYKIFLDDTQQVHVPCTVDRQLNPIHALPFLRICTKIHAFYALLLCQSVSLNKQTHVQTKTMSRPQHCEKESHMPDFPS